MELAATEGYVCNSDSVHIALPGGLCKLTMPCQKGIVSDHALLAGYCEFAEPSWHCE